MVDMDCRKNNLITSGIANIPSSIINSKPANGGSPTAFNVLVSAEGPSPWEASSYEHYLRLPELSKLWDASEPCPEWKNGSVLKPSLQALEITFRLLSVVLSDSRTYTNKGEWRRKLEEIANREIELIAILCEEDRDAPVFDLRVVSGGVLQRDGSSPEVWKTSSSPSIMVSRVSEQSLLPRLRTWKRAEESAIKIGLSIECQFHRSPFTLGLGEPNLNCKPILQYDLICRPADLHALKRNPLERRIDNAENQTLYTVHQIFESWVFAGRQILHRIKEMIDQKDWEMASRDCYVLERVWKMLAEVEALHLLMDPNDFLRLKNQLSIGRSPGDSGLRSRSLHCLTKGCKELKHWVPTILGVEVDPMGGPRIQEAAMRLFHRHHHGGSIHLLQAFQAVEAAVKGFYFAYNQVVTVVMGSLEAKGNHTCECPDALSQSFLEPPYFPSLDAAKTFLGDFWRHHSGGNNTDHHLR